MRKTKPRNIAQFRAKRAKVFIKVVEIWTPSVDQQRLTLVDSLHDEQVNFQQQGKERSFAYDEGLPGKAWAGARPLIISNIAYSFFRRKQAAVKAGLSSAIAVPVFAGDFLQAVVILLCGEDESHTGAIELWGTHTRINSLLSLVDGYYGNLKSFEWISRQIQFDKGSGLPGTVWQDFSPHIISDLGSASNFIRANIARESGVTTGLGIPFRNCLGEEYILTFLSAMQTPIARRFEIWQPDKTQQSLELLASHEESAAITPPPPPISSIKRGEGLMGMVWMTGCPAISHDLNQDGLMTAAAGNKYRSALVFPVNDGGKLKALVNIIF